MPDLSFEAYAEARGYGSLQLPATGPEQDSYLTDLRMMAAQARGAERVSASDRDGLFALRAGITLESEINGLAELVDGVHYSSVTFGYLWQPSGCEGRGGSSGSICAQSASDSR